jgi:hypothetical protein
MIPLSYAPNLDQFAKHHSAVKANIGVHDKQVDELFSACKNLQGAILDGGALSEVFTRVTTEEALSALGKQLSDLFFGNDKADYLGWIAQEIINGTGELPSYIKHAPIWNAYRREFMSVLDDPEIRRAKDQVDRAGERLLHAVQRLTELLNETRDQLSLKYDVPPVPAFSMAAA